MTEDRPLCPEHELRAAMTDAEFWEHVFHPEGRPVEANDDAWAVEFYIGDMYQVGDCIRCSEPIWTDDYEEYIEARNAGIELCDTCADDVLPDLEDDRL